MRRHWRAVFAAVLALPFLLYAALRLGLFTPLVNLAVHFQLKSLTPVQVRVGVLRSDLFSFVEADDMVVLAAAGRSKLPLVTVESLRLEFRGWEALKGEVAWGEALSLARIRGLSVFLLREAGGAWNLSSLDGLKRGPEAAEAAPGLPWLPAARVELEDSQVVLNDEVRGFHGSIDRVQGSLDTRSLPLLAFTLSGRTEGKPREDLSLAGEMDQRDGSLFGRLDLNSVSLARYLNYFLPGKGLSFESGSATLSVRLRRPGGGEFSASGRAELVDGSLRIPGIAQPLTALQGTVAFDPASLRFKDVRARFLDSDWAASGALIDLGEPSFEVTLSNPAFPLQALSEQVQGMETLALTGTAMVDAGLSGPVKRLVVQAQVHAPAMGMLGARLQDVSASARLQGSNLEVSRIQGRLWGGSLEGRAIMGLARRGRLEADLELRGARLELAELNGRRPLPLTGTADLTARAEGLLRDPQVDLGLKVRNTRLGELDLGALESDLAWGPAGLRSRFQGAGGRLSGSINFSRGKDARFQDSHVEIEGMDLARLARGLATAGPSMLLPAAAQKAGQWIEGRLAGTLQAKLGLEGPRRSPELGLRLALQGGRLFFRQGPLRLRDEKEGLPLSLRGDLGFRQGDIHFGREGRAFRLFLNRRGRNFEAQALGRYPLGSRGSPGRLELVVDGDLRILDAWKGFRASQGRLKADLMLGGNLDAPLAQGELGVTGFATDPEAYLAPIRSGGMQVQFREQRVELSTLSFRSGGELNARGNLDLSAGLRGLHGGLNLGTDAEGLRIQDWDGMGSGNLVLEPLQVAVDGEGQPMRVNGRVRLSNALVVYAGRGKKAAAGPTAKPGRPLELDLRIALGANVWYEKRATGGVEIFDPSRWISGTIESVQETFQRPDVFFRLRPTDKDIVLRRQDGELRLVGNLSIDRGRLTLMENDFEIRPERKAALIRFNGGRADVSAEAVGRMRYTRDNEITQRPQQRVVDVIIKVEPLRLEELERSHLADAFLNYSLSFSADPPIPGIAEDQQDAAILNLVVLGDPLIDLQQADSGGGQDSASRLTEAQLNRLISGEAKRQLAKFSRRGFKFLGTQLIDVLRVVPRFSYQSVGGGGATTASQASRQVQESQLQFSDLTVEVGKSVGEQLYASVLWVRFGENGLNSATAGNVAGTQIVRENGLRAGLEFQINPNRTVEAFYNYSLDDNLQPKAFDPRDLSQAHSAVVRLRNTISTGNYTPNLARERRWDRPPEE